MTKKERVLAVMKKEQVDMIPAGFWFHYKSDYTVQQMIDDAYEIIQNYRYWILLKLCRITHIRFLEDNLRG